jgi:hypothetical protein
MSFSILAAAQFCRIRSYFTGLVLVSVLMITACASAATSADFYVAVNGNDSWTGKLSAPNSQNTDGPFASVAQAQIAVRALIQTHPNRPLSVMLRHGIYYLSLSPTNPGTLQFTASDSGTSTMPITWESYPGETPVVNGGIPVGTRGLGLTWNNVSGSLWQVQLPANIQPFEYLYYNGHRRLRSRLQSSAGVGYYMNGSSCMSTQTGQAVEISLCDLGTFLRIANTVTPGDTGCPAVSDGKGDSKCLDRYYYNPSDPVTAWANLNGVYTGDPSHPCRTNGSNYPAGDIETNVINAWTVDIMRIACIDTTNHIVYFTGVTKGISGGEYNYFGPTLGHRYMIENTKDAFLKAQSAGQTGLWFLDRSTKLWTLNYLAGQGEDPNRDHVVMAQLGGIIPGAPASDNVGASLLFASNLSYVTFRGLAFAVDNFIPSDGGLNNDINEGYTLPQAVDCESCQNVTFDSVIIRHTSANGILIATLLPNNKNNASENDFIQNSALYDIGAAAIRVGHSPSGGDWAANVPQFITVQNNLIQSYSRVFVNGEGIAMGNGHDVTFQHNDITDGYHAGISICNNGCPSYQWAANGNRITTQYNHIWNVIQGVTSDGGALYYDVGSNTGSGSGNKVLNNLINDVTDSSIVDLGLHGSGYGGVGVYLDIESADVDVENNVVYRVSGPGLAMTLGPAPGHSANTFNNNIVAFSRKSMFLEQSPWPQNCSSGVRVNITNNLFYFDLDHTSGFYAMKGCADSCGMDYNKFQNFQGNLYWRTDGGFANDVEAFHVLTTPPPPGQASSCGQPPIPKDVWTFFTFSDWQKGHPLVNGKALAMNEDLEGTVSVNPGFNSTGAPTDFVLSSSPVAGFDYTKTNDTIHNAGRTNPVIKLPNMPATFPTYSYTSF